MRGIWIALVLLGLAGCGLVRGAERSEPAARSRASAPAQPVQPSGLYGADEALRDALSGPLQHVGTGTWPGIRRMFSCAFRNARVLVVNVYCSPTDRQALRVAIYSPKRGRVSIYAEGKAGISNRRRADYFTFMVESEPLARAVSLSMTFDELRSYEEQRYAAFLPQCFGGQELGKPRSGCLADLAPRAPAWLQQNRRFLDSASDDWYHLVRDLRVSAVHEGREPL